MTIDLLKAEHPKLDPLDEKARRAVSVFRGLQPTLTAYARAMTGRKDLRVVLAAKDNGSTDGKNIYFRPPIELGDNTPHKKSVCDRRDPISGKVMCPACAIREKVLTTIYHEIAHNAFGSFENVTEEAKKRAIMWAIKESRGKYAETIKERINGAPSYVTDDYMGLVSLINPFLPTLLGVMEDVRVDQELFRNKPGLKKMFAADNAAIFSEGFEAVDEHGQVVIKRWKDAPLNHQAMIAVYCRAQGYDYREWFHSKVVETLDDEKLGGLIEQINEARSVGAVYNLSYKVLQRLRELGFCGTPQDPDPEPEESDEGEDSQQDPESMDQEDESDDLSEGSEDEGSGDPGETDESSGASESGSEHDETSDDGSDSVPGDGAEDQSDASSGDGDPTGGTEEGQVDDTDNPNSEPGAEGGNGSDEASDQGDSNASEGSDSQGQDQSKGEADSSNDGDARSSDDDSGDPGADGTDASDSASDDAGEGAPGDESGETSGSSQGDADGVRESGGEVDDAQNNSNDAQGSNDTDGQSGAGESGHGNQQDDSVLPSNGDSDASSDSDSDSGDSSGLGNEGPSGDGRGDAQDAGAMGASDRPSDEHGADRDDLSTPGSSDGDSTGAPVGEEEHLETGSADETEADRASSGPQRTESLPRDSAGDGPPLPADGDGQGDQADPVDTGADDGYGGTRLEEEEPDDLPEWGDAEGLDEVLKVFGDHDEKPKSIHAQEMEAAVNKAIIQGIYFTTPSRRVEGVREHHFGRPIIENGKNTSRGWENKGSNAHALGAEGDFHTPDSVIASSLTKIRHAFSDNQRGSSQRNLRSGRVDTRALGTRAWDGNPRLFKRDRLPGKKDWGVIMGMDISGSTKGANIALEKRAVYAQCEMLARVGIPFEVYAHTGDVLRRDPTSRGIGVMNYSLDMYHIKGLKEPWNPTTQERLEKLASCSVNLDGHALEFLRKRADDLRATNKVVLYYSDGKMPATNHDEELEILQREIGICERKGYVLLGVGIRTDSPRAHGLDTVEVHGDDDLIKVVEHLGRRISIIIDR